MLTHDRLVALLGFHSLNHIELKPNSATVAGGWKIRTINWC
jgi:hypothetical protein